MDKAVWDSRIGLIKHHETKHRNVSAELLCVKLANINQDDHQSARMRSRSGVTNY